jgi:hypothetical protein
LYLCVRTLVTNIQAYAKQQHAAKQARAGAGFGRYAAAADAHSQHENMMLAAFLEMMMAAIRGQSPAASRAADVEEL